VGIADFLVLGLAGLADEHPEFVELKIERYWEE
jgi:hypothetical protein